MADETWQPIDTAPRALEYDTVIAGTRYAGGEVIRVRGTLDGESVEEFAHWSVIGDKPEHWFIFEQEPLDWTAEEWRPLTADENAELFGESEPA